MKLSSVLFILLLFVLTTNMSAQTEQKRIERLAGLARIWGAVKFYHPFLAYQKIDWDKALVETIPKVNAARSPQDYAAAINSMFAVLGDKATRAELITDEKRVAPKENKQTEPVRMVGDVLVLDIAAITRVLASDPSAGAKFFVEIQTRSVGAKGVIFDCRKEANLSESDADLSGFFFDDFLRRSLSGVLAKNIALASYRYRLHNGYAPQTGQTSGGYGSSLVTDAPQSLTGTGKTNVPFGLIINAGTPDFSDVFGGLQASDAGLIIQDGDSPPDFGANTAEIVNVDGVRIKMRTSELVKPDGNIGFEADQTVNQSGMKDLALDFTISALKENRPKMANNNSVPKNPPLLSLKDETYPEMEFPSSEYRLLALFRFWNVIDNFYPYKNLINDTWKDVLPRYIPKFEADKTAVDYQTTVSEMVAELHDSHGVLRGTKALNESLGNFTVPFVVRYINDRAVVFYLADDKLPVQRGDVVTAIDGEPEAKRRAFMARLFAASTPQKVNMSAAANLFRGAKDSTVKLTVEDVNGKTRTVEVKRTEPQSSPNLRKAFFRTTPVFQVLPEGFGYVDLGRLSIDEVDEMFTKIKDTKGVIFDMRGYPNGTAWSVAPRLTDKINVPAALFSRPIVSARSISKGDYTAGANYTFVQPLPERVGDVYRGRVVVLIDEWAISQAEHTCMFLESATNVTFIGMPTAGADGDVTNLVLPGGLQINFSGHDVRHADGRQLQRIGIVPTIRISPTAKGIAANRDELLERGVRFLQTGK
jgi:C-terminal processing protease CtpA/Prc